MYHEGGYTVSEALVYHKIPGIGQNGAVKSRDVSGQVIEAVARDSACSVHVYSVERFHYLRVVGDLETGNGGLSESLYLDVAAVVRSDGDGSVYHIRDLQHNSADLFCQLGLLCLKAFKPFVYGDDIGFHLFGFILFGGVLFRLAHQNADLL